MYKNLVLGQPELTSIQKAAFQGEVCAVKIDQASNPCQMKRPIYRGDRASESWIYRIKTAKNFF